MPLLCQLTDPDGYRISDWNIAADPRDRDYWISLFDTFPNHIQTQIVRDGLDGDHFPARWSAFQREYESGMRLIRDKVERTGTLSTIELVRYRQMLLKKFDFPDPYRAIKRRENTAAARLYPQVIQRIDELPLEKRWPALFLGLLAGNMFDLGAPKTIDLFKRGQTDFFATLERIADQSWFIDHSAVLIDRLTNSSPWRQILFFVDNAGSDIVLGVLPLAREMARAGARVILAANAEPALNDITYPELNCLLDKLRNQDPQLADLLATDRLATVDTGNDTPLLDCTIITDACNTVAAASDLIVLEGMGRAIESNWHVPLKCDCWRIALLKDEAVVRWLGARLWQPVSRFDPA
ncbi:MAG: DUF89 family protein [Phycisphaerales bacterium]|nr:DUF89 family protein [Phycisphaerales bacterium]